MSCEYEYIRYEIIDGTATVYYKLSSLDVSGRDAIDDDVSEWTDSEIKDAIGLMLGLSAAEKEIIEEF